MESYYFKNLNKMDYFLLWKLHNYFLIKKLDEIFCINKYLILNIY